MAQPPSSDRPSSPNDTLNPEDAGPGGTPSPQLTALILAADTAPETGVARAAEVGNKCLADIGGAPMLARVLTALEDSGCVSRIFISTNHEDLIREDPDISPWLTTGYVFFIDCADSAPASVLAAQKTIPDAHPLLVTTGDSALLTKEMVRHFCRETAAQTDADLTVGVASAATIRGRYPQAKRTYLQFRDDGYSGCNLFILANASAQAVVEFWREAGKRRKAPFKLVATFGLVSLILFALKRLSLREALDRASKKLKVRIKPVIMPQAEAAMDVDKPEDLVLARKLVNGMPLP